MGHRLSVTRGPRPIVCGSQSVCRPRPIVCGSQTICWSRPIGCGSQAVSQHQQCMGHRLWVKTNSVWVTGCEPTPLVCESDSVSQHYSVWVTDSLWANINNVWITESLRVKINSFLAIDCGPNQQYKPLEASHSDPQLLKLSLKQNILYAIIANKA